MAHDAVILIGPMGTGKSTIGKLLAEKLGARHYEMDHARWDYYKEIGYDNEEIEKQRDPKDGVWGIYRLWKPFEIHALERIVADYPDGMVSFGGGHSVYEDDAYLARAKEALAPFPNVVLILPSADAEESLGILQERMPDAPQDIIDLNIHFVRHRSNRELAKHVVYTKGKTPDETCQEIITTLDLKKRVGDMNEKVIESKKIYDGRILNFRVDTVELPNGKTSTREIVEHRGAVATVPMLDPETVVLVRQDRQAAGAALLEIPAGTMDPNEEIETCAHRELAEEIQYQAGRMIELCSFFTAPGYTTEKIFAFLALDLTPCEGHADEDEFLEVVRLPLAKAIEMIFTGEIEDAKSIAGLLCAQRYLAL